MVDGSCAISQEWIVFRLDHGAAFRFVKIFYIKEVADISK